jgi:hypothetical protein
VAGLIDSQAACIHDHCIPRQSNSSDLQDWKMKLFIEAIPV